MQQKNAIVIINWKFSIRGEGKVLLAQKLIQRVLKRNKKSWNNFSGLASR